MSTSPLSRGGAEFAVDLYKRLAVEKGNLFLSPYSVAGVLAMAYGGARGKTAAEMAKVLRLPGPPEETHRLFGELNASLDAAGRDGEVELRAANALWGMKGYAFKKEFLALLSGSHGAGLRELDFGASAAAADAINGWVEAETKEKIKKLIDPGALGSDTRLVLTNAIYFKGLWQSQFKKVSTNDQPFTTAAGGKVQAPLMSQLGDFGYHETPELQALELPYRGERLSMVVLLPRKADGLPALERSLTAVGLSAWLGKLETREVLVYLPRFKTTAQFGLAPTLGAMGMPAAFAGGADFSGIDGGRELFVSAVVHKAFVDVNEEGTEAAAATGMTLGIESVAPEPPTFRADHPFLYLIRDKATGSILFMGRLEDPKA